MTADMPTTPGLDELAMRMARNHIDLTFPDSGPVPTIQSVRGRMLTSPPSDHFPPHESVIVVTGAGLSNHVCNLPTGQQTVHLLHDAFPALAPLARKEVAHLERVYKADTLELETQLLALGKYAGADLPETLQKIFLRRFYPSLSSELLAHLLKHRFIDAVINFNFDETLDQAIDDEVGPSNYLHVLTDRDVPDNLDDLRNRDGRLTRPLYIKPHGTASSRSTLRFTDEDYFRLPEQISNFIAELLITPKKSSLVILGHAMESTEFNYILRTIRTDHASNEITSFIFARNPGKIEDRIRGLVDSTYPITLMNDTFDLSKALSSLWDHVESAFTDSYKPRGALRHHLIHTLFQTRANPKDPETSDLARSSRVTLLEERTIIELLLSIAKSRGFVNVPQLAGSHSRVGRYFDLWKQETGTTTTLRELVQRLGLTEVDYSGQTFRLNPAPPTSDGTEAHLTIGRDDWSTGIDNLVDHAATALPQEKRLELHKNRTLLIDTMNYMFTSTEVEVETRPGQYASFLKRPEPLESIASMNVATSRMLEGTRWQHLIAVAESGLWLNNDTISGLIAGRKGRRIILILADSIHETEIRERYAFAELEVHYVPWWGHNQHLTLLLGENGDPLEGIYFERRLRSLSIAPVRITDETDLGFLRNIGLAYKKKAEYYSQRRSLTVVTQQDIESEKADLRNWKPT